MRDTEIDPGFHNLEQLASLTDTNSQEVRTSYAMQNLFDQKQGLRPRGISIDKKAGKADQRETRRSGVLSDIPGPRATDIDVDPGSHNLEQWSSPTDTDFKELRSSHAMQILFDQDQPLRLRGMPIYVHHGHTVRKATAKATDRGSNTSPIEISCFCA